MRPDPIQQLLQAADPAPACTDPARMAEAVVRRWKRRRAIRAAGASMGGVALLTVGWIALPPASVNRSPAPPMATPVSEPAPPTVAALQELDTRIAQQEAQIQRLIAAERLQQAQARLARLPKEHPEQQIAERAARAVVEQADRVLHETSQSAAALRAYQEVIEYFPQTASAEQAQRRIHDLQKAG